MSKDDNSKPSSPCGGGSCPDGTSKSQDDGIAASLSRIRHAFIVMSGKGGVGKSSISAGLSIRLANRGFSVGLLDVDIHGPSLAGIMGVKGLMDISRDSKVLPKKVNERLGVVSMQSLMSDGDQAVIWRGPAKSGVIRQFIGDVDWGELDFLIIDAPPGTGDEPLSVAQTIPGARAIIVTTPQEVALADVRKSINFCRVVNLEIAGLVENMGPFDCPCCGKKIALFKNGGGQVTAEEMKVAFLGTLPFDARVVKACDSGKPLSLAENAPEFTKALDTIIEKIAVKTEA